MRRRKQIRTVVIGLSGVLVIVALVLGVAAGAGAAVDPGLEPTPIPTITGTIGYY